MPHSHHSHSGQYCAHAKSTLDQVVARAASLGYTTFGLSEHVPRALPSELYPEELDLGLDRSKLEHRFWSYLDHARRIQREHDQSSDSSTMDILVGCETENIDGKGNHLDYLVNLFHPSTSHVATIPPDQIGAGKVDYLVGSLHHVHSVPIDFDPETFQRALTSVSSASKEQDRHDALMLAYLDAQLVLMERLRPEVIGHFDLCRLYRPKAAMRPNSAEATGNLQSIWDKVERNVRYAVSYGALFEINASSFRKGWDTAYPGRDVLELILSLGGRICLSDDSHGVHQVGLNYHRSKAYLLSLSTPPDIWYLRRKRPADSNRGKQDDAQHLAQLGRSHTISSSDRPGDHAPTQFARGTEAIRMPLQQWTAWTGWDTIQAKTTV
ncbi:hypothetical protein OC846_001827 [Tilletia horrida]|uniref:Histidinol-phosphatase n=1 Tax=Tilletia horrida TaxID=155126 RepID=A0AAN6GSA8_9BASI|nr:hypothetical protein OC846_001827 [Tilletia horrida]KAK0568416.1 hypothetical protein OC861_001973 [Tilletia horrida]